MGVIPENMINAVLESRANGPRTIQLVDEQLCITRLVQARLLLRLAQENEDVSDVSMHGENAALIMFEKILSNATPENLAGIIFDLTSQVIWLMAEIQPSGRVALTGLIQQADQLEDELRDLDDLMGS